MGMRVSQAGWNKKFSLIPPKKQNITLLNFLVTDVNLQGVEPEPEFEGTISNVTFPAGREALLTCSVKNLGRYKVSISYNFMIRVASFGSNKNSRIFNRNL